MIFHENCLLADNSHAISSLIFSKIKKDVAKFVVCCSRDWRFKGYHYLDCTALCEKRKERKMRVLSKFCYLGLDVRHPVFGVCKQQRLRPACAGQQLCYSLIYKLAISKIFSEAEETKPEDRF